jgi:hypothetical protein
MPELHGMGSILSILLNLLKKTQHKRYIPIRYDWIVS